MEPELEPKNWEVWAAPGLALLIAAGFDPDKEVLTRVLVLKHVMHGKTFEEAQRIFARMKTFWIKMPEKKSEDQGLTEVGDADTTEAPPKETT